MAKPEVEVLSWHMAEVNGRSALVGHEGARIDCVVWIEVDGNAVTRIDMIRNPDKFGAILA